MSVILECQSGDAFVCIQEFNASPDGTGFSWDTARKFRVGEYLKFVGARQDPSVKDQPTAWFVVFDAVDGKRYAATQLYFVTEECWLGVKRFFARRLLRDPRNRLTPAASMPAGQS